MLLNEQNIAYTKIEQILKNSEGLILDNYEESSFKEYYDSLPSVLASLRKIQAKEATIVKKVTESIIKSFSIFSDIPNGKEYISEDIAYLFRLSAISIISENLVTFIKKVKNTLVKIEELYGEDELVNKISDELISISSEELDYSDYQLILPFLKSFSKEKLFMVINIEEKLDLIVEKACVKTYEKYENHAKKDQLKEKGKRDYLFVLNECVNAMVFEKPEQVKNKMVYLNNLFSKIGIGKEFIQYGFEILIQCCKEELTLKEFVTLKPYLELTLPDNMDFIFEMEKVKTSLLSKTLEQMKIMFSSDKGDEDNVKNLLDIVLASFATKKPLYLLDKLIGYSNNQRLFNFSMEKIQSSSKYFFEGIKEVSSETNYDKISIFSNIFNKNTFETASLFVERKSKIITLLVEDLVSKKIITEDSIKILITALTEDLLSSFVTNNKNYFDKDYHNYLLNEHGYNIKVEKEILPAFSRAIREILPSKNFDIFEKYIVSEVK